MARFSEPAVIEGRTFGALFRLALAAPELAPAVRPGHFLLIRCADKGSSDPLLRRALFIAGADRAAGTITLIFAPTEPGLAWLSHRHPGERLDLFGPLGKPFELENRPANLLLAGSGDALAALLFLAQEAAGQRSAVVLHAAAPDPGLLPPPFLLPPEVEYEGAAGESAPALPHNVLTWADRVYLALTPGLIAGAADTVRAARMRWNRGFAQALVAGPLPCGTGACQGCLIETRAGLRTRCRDGPVFDLRDL